jgi:hypothetical protein
MKVSREFRRLIVDVYRCKDCPYYDEIYTGVISVHVDHLCCHPDVEDPFEVDDPDKIDGRCRI